MIGWKKSSSTAASGKGWRSLWKLIKMIPCPVKGKSSGLRLSASFIWQRGFADVNAWYDHQMNILNEQKMYVFMHFWVRTNCICILPSWPTKRWRSCITGDNTVIDLCRIHLNGSQLFFFREDGKSSWRVQLCLSVWNSFEPVMKPSGLACEKMWHEHHRNLETCDGSRVNFRPSWKSNRCCFTAL